MYNITSKTPILYPLLFISPPLLSPLLLTIIINLSTIPNHCHHLPAFVALLLSHTGANRSGALATLSPFTSMMMFNIKIFPFSSNVFYFLFMKPCLMWLMINFVMMYWKQKTVHIIMTKRLPFIFIIISSHIYDNALMHPPKLEPRLPKILPF